MHRSIASFVCLSVLLTVGGAAADILTVGDTWDYQDIQSAVVDANDGDTILVYPGVYTDVAGNGYVVSPQYKELSIFAVNGPEETIIDGQGSTQGVFSACCSTPPPFALEGFTIRNCVGYEGAGLYFYYGTVTVSNCVFIDNEAVSRGGAISAAGYASTITITDCQFENNSSAGSGGAMYFNSSINSSCTSSEFVNNTSSYDGGAVRGIGWGSSNPFVFEDCTFDGNHTDGNGGAMWAANTDVYNSFVSENTASFGGGLYFYYNARVGDTLFCLNDEGDISGSWSDLGGNTFSASCACPDGPCTIVVPTDYPTIQKAIDACGPGDVIEVLPGTYYEALQFGDLVNLEPGPGGVTLRASDVRGEVIVDASDIEGFPALDVFNDGMTIIEGITFTGGTGDYGGGVELDSAAKLIRCTITGNTASVLGGGVSTSDVAAFEDCIITDNEAPLGGGVYLDRLYNNNATGNSNGTEGSGPAPIFWNCTIESNTAEERGGGVYFGGSLLFNDNGSITTAFDTCVITDNASPQGGGVYAIGNNPNNNGSAGNNPNNNGSAVPVIIRDCVITNNAASEDGGAVYMGFNSHVAIESSQFQGNAGGYGGALFMLGDSAYPPSRLEVENSQFTSNTAYFGGSMYLEEWDAVVNNSTFDGNDAPYGGAIYGSSVELELIGSTFTGNTAYQGGGLFGFDTISGISGSTFQENTAEQAGGAIYNFISISEIDTSLFCSNAPDDIFGAWTNDGDVTFEPVCGGGLFCIGDTNKDLNVDVLDLLYVILVWNTDNPLADFNGDGYVDVMDLLTVIANWNQCNQG